MARPAAIDMQSGLTTQRVVRGNDSNLATDHRRGRAHFIMDDPRHSMIVVKTRNLLVGRKLSGHQQLVLVFWQIVFY